MPTKPTYEELTQVVLTFDKTLKTLYNVLGKNPTSESGKTVNLLLMLNPLWDIDAIVAALKEPEAQEPTPVASNIQKYLENFDEYSFTDLMLRDLIDQEERRQSKNCPEVQSRDEIRASVELDFDYGSMQLAVMIAKALSYAAKGDTK